MECCGFDDGYDYNYSYFANTALHRNPWPSSCCALSSSGIPVDLISCLDGSQIVQNSTNAEKVKFSELV